jgi:alpha-L-rhamnosidase
MPLGSNPNPPTAKAQDPTDHPGPFECHDRSMPAYSDIVDEEPGDARTNGTLVADAYLVHVTSTMAQISSALGETADACDQRSVSASITWLNWGSGGIQPIPQLPKLRIPQTAARFQSDACQLKSTFQGKYIAQSGLVVGDTQTALSLEATW